MWPGFLTKENIYAVQVSKAEGDILEVERLRLARRREVFKKRMSESELVLKVDVIHVDPTPDLGYMNEVC